MDISVAFENVIRLLTDISFVPFAVGFVLVTTQIIKSIFKFEGNRAALVALGVQVLVWVVYSVFKARGLDGQFEQGIKGLETILVAISGVLLPAILSGLGSQSVYNRLTDKKVVGFRKVTKVAA
jgi:hypothetical protein